METTIDGDDDMMSPEQLRRIHEAGLRVLSRTGMVFRDPEARAFFARHGFAVDGARVTMTPEQVQTSLATIPAAFTLEARNPSRDLMFGGDGLVVASGAGPALIADEQGARACIDADLVSSIKLAHLLPNLDMVGFPLEPQDIPPADRYARSVQCALTLTDKPLEYALSTAEQVRIALDTSEILYGSAWHERLRLFAVVNTVSPLQLEAGRLSGSHRAGPSQPGRVRHALRDGRDHGAGDGGRGLWFCNTPRPWPVWCWLNCVQPGCPVVYGGFSSLASMVSGDPLFGIPEYWAAMTATVELARSLGLPCRAGAAITDAHVPDMQAGIESTAGMASVIQAGVNFILHGAGILSALNAISFEKLVIDDEMVGMLRTLRTGFPVDEESMAVDVIDHVGRGGQLPSGGSHGGPLPRQPAVVVLQPAPVRCLAAARGTRYRVGGRATGPSPVGGLLGPRPRRDHPATARRSTSTGTARAGDHGERRTALTWDCRMTTLRGSSSPSACRDSWSPGSTGSSRKPTCPWCSRWPTAPCTPAELAERIPGLSDADVERAHHRGMLDRAADGRIALADFHARFEIWAIFEGWKDVPAEIRAALNDWELEQYEERKRPQIEALRAGREPDPGLENSEYLLLHEAEALLERVDRIYLWPCNCRSMMGECSKPVNTCLRFSNERGVGWEISRERAVEIVRQANKAGLMQTGEVVESRGGVTGAICNCCADCCYPHLVSARLGAEKLWPRSRYVARHLTDECTACGRCARRCPFGAFVADTRVAVDTEAAHPGDHLP